MMSLLFNNKLIMARRMKSKLNNDSNPAVDDKFINHGEKLKTKKLISEKYKL